MKLDSNLNEVMLYKLKNCTYLIDHLSEKESYIGFISKIDERLYVDKMNENEAKCLKKYMV